MPKRARMSDISLAYRDVGTGDALVLLHGNGESSDYFSHQIEHFRKSYRVIAPDTRGHGDSPRGKLPMTLSQFADDLRSLLDKLGIARVNILGFSDGGNTALIFALRYPEYVDRLILNGANLFPRGVKLTVQLPICIGYGIVSIISKFDRRAEAHRELLALMVKEPHISSDDLQTIVAPTLVIVGTHDMIRDSHSRMIAESIPNAEFVRIDGGHFIAAEQSDQLNLALDDFLCRSSPSEKFS